VISGIVIDRKALVTLSLSLANGSTIPIEFVVDTGFTGQLCLPSEAVSVLGLPFLYDLPANLADNSEVILPVHEGLIIWDGEEREVLILATGRTPLLGTALLEGQELIVQFTENGLVTIDALSSRAPGD
jgi:clan AA aspartic protease